MPRPRGGSQPQITIPFVGAAHAYRRKYYTVASQAINANNNDISPPGNAIFSYGFLRAHLIRVSTATAASDGTLGADGVWGLIHTLQIRQPGGQEMWGGPNFGGMHAYLATANSGWKLMNDPALLPSYTNSATSPAFTLRQVFELNAQTGLGSLPNQNDAAPWQIQIDTATNTAAYTTKPTTTNPNLKFEFYVECWTVPSPRNPLRPNIAQVTAPPLLGTLNKWTVQQRTIPGGSSFDADLVRKGNSLRNLAVILYNSSNARIAASNFPSPLTIEWDGTLIRANEDPNLMIDDEAMVRGGWSGGTSIATAPTGVIWLKMGDPAGVDLSAAGLDGLGMVKQWGTTQTGTILFSGSWGATASYVNFLTNDVQYVLPSPNPYALAAGQPYISQAAQPSAVG